MMNTKLGLNRAEFEFNPFCKDKIKYLDRLTSVDGKINLIALFNKNYQLITDDPNAYMDLNKYHNMEFINDSERIRNFQNGFKGIKESIGKLDYELDFDFITQMAEKMSLNKSKYEPYNWKKPIDIELLKQSLFRHVIEIMKDNYEDDNREFGHLESAALNCMMINYQLKNIKHENTSPSQ